MNVLVVDDHAVVRQGLRDLLARIPDTAVEEAASTLEAAGVLRNRPIDVIVLDLNVRGGCGLELMGERDASTGPLRVVVFSMQSEPSSVRRAFDAGVLGFVAKTSRPEELLTAVKRAAQGERYLDERIARTIAEGVASGGLTLDGLSPREGEILELLGEGKSITEIAAILGVAYKTVANTSLRLRDKLGAKGPADLVRIAIEARKAKPGR